MIQVTRIKRASLFTLAFAMASGCDTHEKASVMSYPESDSPGARILLEKCGMCHAAPLPSSHVASIWPGVLQRMQIRMTSKGQRALQPEETGILLDYLQRHARIEE